MHDAPEVPPIHGDERRQASASIAGYVYQLWHSVYAWLRLGDSEVLYLEGAEDFDVVSSESADASQVKHSLRPLTLNSPDVVSAIENFLEIREKNTGTRVRYRYITRAPIGVEKQDPFGSGRGGIEVWNQVKGHSDDASTLIAFLRQSDKLTASVTAWLSTASDEAVLNDLILPITWETEQPGSEAIEKSVKDLLVNHGADLGVSPTMAEKVSSRLFSESAAVASRKNSRNITRADFLRFFEQETAVTVPAHKLVGPLAAQPAFPISAEALGSHIALSIQAAEPVLTDVPSISNGFSSRSSAVEDIAEKFKTSVVLDLVGSTGAGKSTLAKLVLLKSGAKCIWIDCGVADVSRMNAAFRYASLLIQSSSDNVFIVIDGFDVSESEALKLELALASLFFVADENGCVVLTTSQRQLPTRLLRSCAGARFETVQMPHMTEEEIGEVLTANGAPEGTYSDSWSKIVLLHTSGHAQLVHARVLALKSANWPEIEGKDVIETPKDVELEKEEVRKRLFQDLDSDKLELLYRLSVMLGLFRREHAIHIGNSPPPVGNVADQFDQLVGPWIEKVGDNIYKVSPLVLGVAKQVWTAPQLAAAHSRVAAALLSIRSITSYEAQACLFHAFIAQDHAALTVIAVNLLTAPFDVQEDVASQLSWLIAVRTDNTEPVFTDNPFTNFIMRSLQFRVAALQGEENAPEIAAALVRETVPHEPIEVYPLEQMSVSAMLLINYNVQLPAKMLIEQLQVMADLSDSGASDIGKLPADFAGFRPSVGVPTDTTSALTAMLIPRFGPLDFLVDFLTQLDSSTDELRNKILDGLLSMRDWNLFIDKTWSAHDELQEEDRDWDSVIDVMNVTVSYGRKWGRLELVVGGLRALAIIHDEYLGDTTEAVRILQDDDAASLNSPVIQDALATVLYHDDDYIGALAIWDDILSDPRMVEEDGNFTFSFAKAGRSAEEIGQHDKAALHYENGAIAANHVDNPVFEAAYLADSAFAAWTDNDFDITLSRFRRSLEIVEHLDSTQSTSDYRAIRRLITHTLLFVQIKSDYKDPREFTRSPGLCTRLTYHKSLSEMPFGDVEFSLLHLMQIEHSLKRGDYYFDELSERLCNSKYIAVRCFAWDMRIRKAIVHASPDDAFSALRNYQIAMAQNAAERAAGASILDEAIAEAIEDETNDAFAKETTVGIALGLASNDTELAEFVEKLKSSPWKGLGTDLDSVLEKSPAEVVRSMRDQNESGEVRLFSAMRLSIEPAANARIDDLYYAHCILADCLRLIPWRREIVENLIGYVRRQWLNKVENATASLKSPRSTAPAIEAACNESGDALTCFAKILVAVSAAVGLHLPSKIKQQLSIWSDGKDDVIQ